jgi:hypothetical protein
MSVGVVTDPVSFGMSARRETPPFGIVQFLSDHKERGSKVAASEGIQHMRRHIRFRAIIERQR